MELCISREYDTDWRRNSSIVALSSRIRNGSARENLTPWRSAIGLKSRLPAPGTRQVLLVSAILALMGFALFYESRLVPRKLRIHEQASRSPYKNTRAGVKYLGDAACIGCHKDIAQTYRNHPMGGSLYPIAQAPLIAGQTASSGPLFAAQGFEYFLENQNGRVVHKEIRRDGRGHVIAEADGEVRFAVGSGRLGIAYLIERDGYLFQSPIAWYARNRRWDLPPGYEKSNRTFRPADSVGMPVLPLEPLRSGRGNGQPLSAAILRRACDWL